ncbi:MAG: TRAP transporter large permease [Deltaproteobacteria bacterium]|nr:TRAP transporter large permease [Deltaproteobacteria bacterium]
MLTMAISFLITLLSGMPIAFCLGITALVTLLATPDMTLLILPQKMFTGVDYFTLVAVPFFILAGELMNKARITDSIIALSQYLVGRFRGGLAHVTIMASMFFAGITGAAVAEVSALGSILIPAMEKANYPKSFAAAVSAAGAVMGPIIPPSIIMVVYALVDTRVSIGALFLAGVLPGIAIGLLQMIAAYAIALKYNYPRFEEKFDAGKFLQVLKRALIPLFTPVIIMGGILGGICTPTEAAAVAVIYALIVGLLIFRTLQPRDLPKIFLNTTLISSTVFFIFCMGNVLVVLFTINQVPEQLGKFILSISTNPMVFLILINILLLIVGCFMEVGVAIIILVPMLSPVASHFGIDPLHFAMIVVVNLCIGLITPPVGVVLFVACGISGLTMEQVTRSIWPFFLAIIVVLLLVTFIPSFTLVVPKMFGITG